MLDGYEPDAFNVSFALLSDEENQKVEAPEAATIDTLISLDVSGKFNSACALILRFFYCFQQAC